MLLADVARERGLTRSRVDADTCATDDAVELSTLPESLSVFPALVAGLARAWPCGSPTW